MLKQQRTHEQIAAAHERAITRRVNERYNLIRRLRHAGRHVEADRLEADRLNWSKK